MILLILFHLLIVIALLAPFIRESGASDELVLVFGPWIPEVEAALPDDVEVLACLQHFVFVFREEYGHHLLATGEPLLPVLVVEVLLEALLALRAVLTHYELVERVLQDALEDPLPQDLEVGLCTLF